MSERGLQFESGFEKCHGESIAEVRVQVARLERFGKHRGDLTEIGGRGINRGRGYMR